MTKKSDYKNIVRHYESCLERHGDTHKGVDWPNEKDAYTRYKVMLDVIKEENEKTNLLDFGCGAAHMLSYMQKNPELYKNINYSGADLSSKFIDLSRKKFPKTDFYCIDLLEDELSEVPNFDYAILNGVFTEKQDLTFDEMWLFFKKMILAIFEKVDKGIAFNVMSKDVDWERDDLFHLSLDLLTDFLTQELSRDFIIRNDYGLYEYTVYLYK
ncbi:class I SAM-dependent methyltransferase [Marixanthomonas ophiurae]|uniref:Class I SAM-dependent methyltransferase n=1 Tax=Marixanthomonas ophiurae TaxID=387659 RepID=A0A3E1QD14_9FLAO|nr:class I SAM-dependent methyltransferase [Marixanthomonas ophiurae]RFN60038.1 class I SAM-dependent methyltransferase [Marixanthomonas ophiurae]